MSIVQQRLQSAQQSTTEQVWLTSKEPVSSRREPEGGADEVEQLIRRHEAFRKAAASWKEHFSSLRQVRMAVSSALFWSIIACTIPHLAFSISPPQYPLFSAHPSFHPCLSLQLPVRSLIQSFINHTSIQMSIILSIIFSSICICNYPSLQVFRSILIHPYIISPSMFFVGLEFYKILDFFCKSMNSIK